MEKSKQSIDGPAGNQDKENDSRNAHNFRSQTIIRTLFGTAFSKTEATNKRRVGHSLKRILDPIGIFVRNYSKCNKNLCWQVNHRKNMQVHLLWNEDKAKD
jgi:hypothetical protein